MDVKEMNRKVMHMVEQWNPLNLERESYQVEAEQVLTALQQVDDPSDLGKNIQEIYQHSFQQWIPIEKCVEISYKLIAIKFEMKSIL